MIDLLNDGGSRLDGRRRHGDHLHAASPTTVRPAPSATATAGRAPGISFDEETCEHSGSLSPATCSGPGSGWSRSSRAAQPPRCPSAPATTSTPSTTSWSLAAARLSPTLVPGLYEYDPGASLTFGEGEYHVGRSSNPDCVTGTRVAVQQLRVPLRRDLLALRSALQPLRDASSDMGLTHALTANGPTPADKFATRPFVASFEMRYCTADNGARTATWQQRQLRRRTPRPSTTSTWSATPSSPEPGTPPHAMCDVRGHLVAHI